MSTQDAQNDHQPEGAEASPESDAQALRKLADFFPQMKKFMEEMMQSMPQPNVPGVPGMPEAPSTQGTVAPEAADPAAAASPTGAAPSSGIAPDSTGAR